MSAREELNAYLSGLHRRLKIGTLTRGAAVAGIAALAMTLILVLALQALLFSTVGVRGARLSLIVVLACIVCGCIVLPLRRLTRRRAAAAAETRDSRFQQRLLTFIERDTADPFVELLAADTLELTRSAGLPALATDTRLRTWFAVAALSVGALIWLIAAAPGTLGYGAHLLWTNGARGTAPVYDIRVMPGDLTIRRYSDQLVAAQPQGIKETRMFLFARYQNNPQWERIAMQSRADQPGYQFTLTAVPENVEYYVEAGARQSPHYRLRVADPPVVRQIRVTYHFPSWTGRADETEEAGGDLRALKGTRAELELTTDRPMTDGTLVLSTGQAIALSGGENNHYRASVELQSDGDYHVASVDHGQPVRISEDYFIEARDPTPPTVSIVRPGGDYRASPIEEVSIALHATDEFGLKHLDLHYAVNGGAEKTIGLLDRDGAKQVDGRSVLALESFKLAPGDLVSLYATAADAQLEAHTDIAFIQIEPFSRSFSQSQASGVAGGGPGNASGEISQREKEIISATFKQLNDAAGNTQQASETAKLLSEIQTTLRQQSLALSGRLRSRELSEQNSEFGRFQQEMREAANAMSPAAEQLQRQNWKDAIPEEQKVLQHLLRAEATFREIEIAFGARGGGGSDAGRDLASLFDLELDTGKNQYEAQQRASSADQRAKDINDALKKLDELARRQEELAERQRDQPNAGAEQRWQQEMLKREAEELEQQLQQMAQGSQRPGQPGSGGQGQSQPTGGSQDQSQSRAQAAQQALDRVRQAQQDMAGSGASGGSAADARRAAERLKEASNILGGMQSQEAGQRLEAIAREAERLAGAEAEQRARLQRLKERGAAAPTAARDVEKLRADRQSMADALSALQKNMRNAAREFATDQRIVAEKLRDALKEVDDGDLEPLVQRTADWLRTGIDPNARDTESQIAAGLARLRDQTREAQQALNSGDSQRGQGMQEALDRVARLRRQIEEMRGGSQAGDTQPGGGAAGFVDNNIDTGNNARSGVRSNVAPSTAPAGPDTEARIQQGLGELRALRQQAAEDPDTRRQVQQLITAMEHLDARRFPGNPHMIEQIQQQLLSDVDTLDLQLRRNLAGAQAGEIRSPDPAFVPRGYEDAVADYFRRLGNQPVHPTAK